MMLSSFFRKLDQLKNDPVLRRWLWGRATGKWKGGVHPRTAPPYLTRQRFSDATGEDLAIGPFVEERPATNASVSLAGEMITLTPEDPDIVFGADFSDTERLLALHRFTWMDTLSDDEVRLWVRTVFPGWYTRFVAAGSDDWVWHPYTASERLIRLSWFCRQYGFPGPPDTVRPFLYQHGPKILESLEYYGDVQTGNHLVNSGRGLYLGGLNLGMREWVENGAEILLTEGTRIFERSGILREGSSHYHLLVTKWFVECWLAASDQGLPESDSLQEIAGKALAAAQLFDMPAGIPLIGDISPDCAPASLACLVENGGADWESRMVPGQLSGLGVSDSSATGQQARLREDGWSRIDKNDWSALWYVSPDGWAPQPGHGHRDFGSFELHFGEEPIFVDPGRGAYGASGESDKSAEFHNTLMIDALEPYPVNRPYYDASFRRLAAGAPPQVTMTENSMAIESDCFGRLAGGLKWRREWLFDPSSVEIRDHIDGSGRHSISRFLHTVQPATLIDAGDETGLDLGPVRLMSDVRPGISASRRWVEYGKSVPASRIVLQQDVTLPWTSVIKVTSLG